MLASKCRRGATRSCHCSLLLLRSVQFLRQLRVTDFIGVKVNQKDSVAVFHFALTQIVEISVPTRVRRKVLCYMFREEDVSRIAAIHHPLRDVDSSSGD